MQAIDKSEYLIDTSHFGSCDEPATNLSQQHNIGAYDQSSNVRLFDVVEHYNTNVSELSPLKKKLAWIVKTNLSLPNDVKISISIDLSWSKLTRAERRDRFSSDKPKEEVNSERQYMRKMRSSKRRRARAERKSQLRQQKIMEIAEKARQSQRSIDDCKRSIQLRSKERKANDTIKLLTRLATKRIRALPSWRIRLGEGDNIAKAAKTLSIPFGSYRPSEADELKAQQYKIKQAEKAKAALRLKTQLEREERLNLEAIDRHRRRFFDLAISSPWAHKLGVQTYAQFKVAAVQRTVEEWIDQYDKFEKLVINQRRLDRRAENDMYF